MKNDILHIAEYGTLDEMKEVIKKGIDINIRDKEDGGTPLMGAIAYENEAIALFLLEHGADPKIKDNEEMNALHYATGNGMTNVAKAILKKAPEALNVVDKNGVTPLWKAVHYPKTSLEFIEYLLQKGADKLSVMPLVKAFNEKELTQLFESY